MQSKYINIEGVNYTKYINQKNYKVGQTTKYDTFVAGDNKEYQMNQRKKVQGTVELAFVGARTACKTLCDTVKTKSNSDYGTLSVSLYDQSAGAVVSIDAYVDIVPVNTVDLPLTTLDRIQLTIKEL